MIQLWQVGLAALACLGFALIGIASRLFLKPRKPTIGYRLQRNNTQQNQAEGDDKKQGSIAAMTGIA
jgi:hypothetical protein